MPARPTDAEAIRSSLTRPEAFETIFERHFAAISRFVRRRLPTPVADDLVADVFTAAFAARRSYRLDRDDALPWLYGIATNLVRRHVRDESRELETHARAGRSAESGNPRSADRAERLEPRVARALLALDAGDREVVLLFAWADLSHAQIAEALSLPVGTVKSRLHRARRHLRASLGLGALTESGRAT